MTEAEARALRGPPNYPKIPIKTCPLPPSTKDWLEKFLGPMLWYGTDYAIMVDGVPLKTHYNRYELTTTDGRHCFWIVTDNIADYFYFDPDRTIIMEL